MVVPDQLRLARPRLSQDLHLEELHPSLNLSLEGSHLAQKAQHLMLLLSPFLRALQPQHPDLLSGLRALHPHLRPCLR